MPVCKNVGPKKRKICIGDLNTLVTLQTRTLETNGFDNPDYTETFTDFSTQVWASIQTTRGFQSFSDVGIENNKLTVKSNATDSWNAINTKHQYRLKGDFDIQVEFEVISGPESTRWHSFLAVYTESGSWSRIERFYHDLLHNFRPIELNLI